MANLRFKIINVVLQYGACGVQKSFLISINQFAPSEDIFASPGKQVEAFGKSNFRLSWIYLGVHYRSVFLWEEIVRHEARQKRVDY